MMDIRTCTCMNSDHRMHVARIVSVSRCLTFFSESEYYYRDRATHTCFSTCAFSGILLSNCGYMHCTYMMYIIYKIRRHSTCVDNEKFVCPRLIIGNKITVEPR